ncbi:MAG: DUF4810 domain-containing protein [Proteobacteria bacterium]|nr:DUF4810 domain-containing protein [Pseudomonadota bacterium]
MNALFKTSSRWIIALGFIALGVGCAQKPVALYHWGAYQDQVYAYFKNTDVGYEQQIIELEVENQKARASGIPLPPGFHAHLALLYAQIGKDDQVVQQLETEKTLFPESSGFMDFLLAKYTGQGVPK